MILNLSELSDEPLHAQISRQIRAKILSDTLGGGDALPSIRGKAMCFFICLSPSNAGRAHPRAWLRESSLSPQTPGGRIRGLGFARSRSRGLNGHVFCRSAKKERGSLCSRVSGARSETWALAVYIGN